MKEKLILGIKGFLLGVANIIPGVSGGTIAIVMGIYEKLISIINNFFKNIKDNILYLLPIGIGIVASVLLLGKVISYSLDNFALITILFFIGLIIGGLPILYKEIKGKESVGNGIVLLVSYVVIFFLAFGLKEGKAVSFESMNIINYLILFVVGIIAAATMVIPGVSGSMVLMIMGYYKPIIDVISDLTNFSNLGHNMAVLIPFGIGVVLGIWLVAKLINFLFAKFKTKTFFGIIGFVLASVFIIIGKTPNLIFNPINIIIGIVLFVFGGFVSYKLSKLEK